MQLLGTLRLSGVLIDPGVTVAPYHYYLRYSTETQIAPTR